MWHVSSVSVMGPLLLLLLAVVVGVPGLKDVQVSVPEAAAAGDTVTLQCRYDMEQDTLYSLKWYKGRLEFFRYIPKELPHTKVFPLPGFDVDVGRSGPGVVVLRSVSPVMSGRFRCEVSADAPSFHTAMKTSYMHVVELPESAPVITAEKTRVSAGDTLRVHCTAPPAHPPANLTWLLNNVPVKGTPMDLDPPVHQKPTRRPPSGAEHSYVPASRNVTRLFGQYSESDRDPEAENIGYVLRGQRNVDRVGTPPKNTNQEGGHQQRNIDEGFHKKGMEERLFSQGDSQEELKKSMFDIAVAEQGAVVKRSSASSLVLAIGPESFLQGRLTLTCKATVFSLYNAQAHLILDGEKPQIASVLGTRESSSGAGNVSAARVLPFLLPLLLLHRILHI